MAPTRDTSPRVTLAAIAIAALILPAIGADGPRSALQDPAACPGAIDGAASAVAALLPHAAAGAIAGGVAGLSLWLALVAIGWLARLASGSAMIALLAMLSAAVTPALARAPAPGHAAAIAAAALLLRSARGTGLGASFVLSAVALASIAPVLTWPLAAAIVVLHLTGTRASVDAAGRLGPVLLATSAILIAGHLTAWLVPPPVPATCGPWPVGLVAGWPDQLRAAFAGIGPAVPALAALGAVTWPAASLLRARDLAFLVLLPALAIAWSGGEGIGVLALPTAATWMLAACGMREVLRWPATRAGTTMAAALLLLVPVLQFARRAPDVPDRADVPRGHLEATGDTAAAIMSALPPGAALVQEDALVALLWRSLEDTKDVRLVPATRAAVATARSTGEVFALPRAQSRLAASGVEFLATGRTGAPGLARVASVAPCLAPGSRWDPVALPPGTTGLSLVAIDDRARGPLIVYLAAREPVAVTPDGWPDAAARGFYPQPYALDEANDRARFDRDRTDDRLPADWPAGDATHLTRIEFWRVPGAPLRLTVRLADANGHPVAATGSTIGVSLVARLHDAPVGPPPALCPAFDAPDGVIAGASSGR